MLARPQVQRRLPHHHHRDLHPRAVNSANMCSQLNVLFFAASALAMAVQKDPAQSQHIRRQYGTEMCGTQPYDPLEYTCFAHSKMGYHSWLVATIATIGTCMSKSTITALDECIADTICSCSTDETLTETTVQPEYTGIVTLYATYTSDTKPVSTVVAQNGRLTVGGLSSSHCPIEIDLGVMLILRTVCSPSD